MKPLQLTKSMQSAKLNWRQILFAGLLIGSLFCSPVVTLFAAEEGFVSELRACELLPAPMSDDESQSLRMVRREGWRNAGSGEK